MKLRTFILMIILSLATGGSLMANVEELLGVPRFAQVGENLYRSAQPTEEGFKALKEFGIKTVINFRHEEEWIESDRNQLEPLGIEYQSIPWTIYGSPDEKVLNEFAEILKDQNKYPILFHCKRGVERTGVMSFYTYSVLQGDDPKLAWDKAFDGYPLKFIWKPFAKRHVKFIKKEVLNQ